MTSSPERDYLGKALDIAIRLGVIFIVLLAAFRIFSPFLAAVLWGVVISVALFPLYAKTRRILGGRAKLAGGLFIVVSLAVVLVPTFLLGDSLLSATVDLIQKGRDGTLEIPAPTEEVRQWPLVGDRVYKLWQDAHVDLQATAAKLQPQLHDFSQGVIRFVADLGGALLVTVFSLVIAGLLMISATGAGRVSYRIATRLAGKEGPALVDLMVGTIRSVVKGVILVALVQGVFAAIGLVIAGVPGVGLWALLVVIVAVIQLPPILILGPIAAWVFANNDSTGVAVFFLVWSLVVSGSDGLLKPIFLGRGVQVPMLVILIGAIGGMLQGGVIGLFLGPVFLAVFYMLFQFWVREELATPSEAGS